jgi:hypothetical protein
VCGFTIVGAGCHSTCLVGCVANVVSTAQANACTGPADQRCPAGWVPRAGTTGCSRKGFEVCFVIVIVDYPAVYVHPSAGITVKLAVKTILSYPSSSSVQTCDALFAAMTEDDFFTAKRVLSDILKRRGYNVNSSQMDGFTPMCEVVSSPSARRRRRLEDSFVFSLTYEFQVTNVVSDTALLVCLELGVS